MPARPTPKPRRRFHDADVEKLQAALTTGQQNREPKSRSRSMRDVVWAARADIVTLRKRGYTVGVIAEMIHGGGFSDVALSTLRRYVSETSTRKRRRKLPPQSIAARQSPPHSQDAPGTAQSPAAPARAAEFDVIPDHDDL